MTARRRGRGVIAAAIAAAVLSLGACAGPHNDLGTGSTACFKALPAAEGAVDHKGKLVGVRDVKAASLAKRRPEFAQDGNKSLCLVAFRGTYAAGEVAGAVDSTRSGSYAVVAVDAKKDTVVRSLVLDTLPMRFSHPV